MARRMLVRITVANELKPCLLPPILGIFPKLLSALRAAGIITEDLSLPQDATHDLEASYRGICVRPMKTGQEFPIRRRLGGRATHSRWNRFDPQLICVDLLAIPWECRGAALIYFTVSSFGSSVVPLLTVDGPRVTTLCA